MTAPGAPGARSPTLELSGAQELSGATQLFRADWQPSHGSHEERLDFMDGLARLRATSLLFVGSVMGLLGFIFAGFLGFYKATQEAPNENFRGQPMNHSYFPATVSEMV